MGNQLHGCIVPSVALATMLVLMTGCSSFNYDWNHATGAASANDITGKWQGTWKSEATGHTDQLRCLMTKIDEGTYEARFRAKYHTIMTFGYTVPLKVTKEGETFKFTGEADLGALAGGIYKYDGHASVTNFFSTYGCSQDHGTFELKRP